MSVFERERERGCCNFILGNIVFSGILYLFIGDTV